MPLANLSDQKSRDEKTNVSELPNKNPSRKMNGKIGIQLTQ